MTKQLLIIGARGFGREVYNMSNGCRGFHTEFTVKGFLDDKADALDEYKGYPPIISSVEEYVIQPDDVFICALGDVRQKEIYAEKILLKGGEFISLTHKSADIGMNTKINEGCIICRMVSISCDIVIGKFVVISAFTSIGHDVKVGDWSHIGAHCFMGGFSTLEGSVTMHPGSRILPNKKVGNGAKIGAGSTVILNVKSNTTVMGVPAIKIADRNNSN